MINIINSQQTHKSTGRLSYNNLKLNNVYLEIEENLNMNSVFQVREINLTISAHANKKSYDFFYTLFDSNCSTVINYIIGHYNTSFYNISIRTVTNNRNTIDISAICDYYTINNNNQHIRKEKIKNILNKLY